MGKKMQVLVFFVVFFGFVLVFLDNIHLCCIIMPMMGGKTGLCIKILSYIVYWEKKGRV